MPSKMGRLGFFERVFQGRTIFRKTKVKMFLEALIELLVSLLTNVLWHYLRRWLNQKDD